jgi:hypothetical protein
MGFSESWTLFHVPALFPIPAVAAWQAVPVAVDCYYQFTNDRWRVCTLFGRRAGPFGRHFEAGKNALG